MLDFVQAVAFLFGLQNIVKMPKSFLTVRDADVWTFDAYQCCCKMSRNRLPHPACKMAANDHAE